MEIREYYGLLNEVRMGARSRVPAKPRELIDFEIQSRLKIPMVSGGLIDQPYIWLLTNQVVAEEIDWQSALRSINEASAQGTRPKQ